MDKEVKIDFVNPRKDNRPPSIKCDDGNYYTISDESYASIVPWKGQPAQISFNTNAKGFHVLTHLNGMAIPQGDQRSRPAPVGIPSTNSPPPPNTNIAPPSVPMRPQVSPPAHATKDTFPSVREQFIKEVVGGWARNGLVLPVLDDLIAATNIAKRAWVSVVEAPMDPSEPNKGLLAPPNAEQVRDLNNQYDPPMPNSPDDYR